MAGARRVHVLGSDGKALCGHYTPKVGDVTDPLVRKRFTSAVTCVRCRGRHMKAQRVKAGNAPTTRVSRRVAAAARTDGAGSEAA